MADQDEVEDGSLILVDDLDDSDIQVRMFFNTDFAHAKNCPLDSSLEYLL